MSINAFIQEVADKLSFISIHEQVPQDGQSIELLLPSEIPKIKSYLELDIVRGVYTMASSLAPDLISGVDPTTAVVLINPTLDIAECPGVIVVHSYQSIFWRDAAMSALSAPKVFPFVAAQKPTATDS